MSLIQRTYVVFLSFSLFLLNISTSSILNYKYKKGSKLFDEDIWGACEEHLEKHLFFAGIS